MPTKIGKPIKTKPPTQETKPPTKVSSTKPPTKNVNCY